jgi:hypothetical protein
MPSSSPCTSNTKGNIFQRLYNYLFTTTTTDRTILCTGKWREFPDRQAQLEHIINNPVTELSHEDEGIRQGQCAHALMTQQGYIGQITDAYMITDTNMDNTTESLVFLYLGAGRGSTQFTLLDMNGKLVEAFNIATGYPKNGQPDIALLNVTAKAIHDKYGDRIMLIVAFDSIYHVLKAHKCDVIPDKTALPNVITTTGKHFTQLGYLTEYFDDTQMIVVRNFITNDGVARKITFATGDDLLIDLGSGNVSLVDPTTGVQCQTYELPADWMTNDVSLIKVGSSIEKLIIMAKDYDADNADVFTSD